MYRFETRRLARHRALSSKVIMILLATGAVLVAMIYLIVHMEDGTPAPRPATPVSAVKQQPASPVKPLVTPPPPAPPVSTVGSESDPAAGIRLDPELFDFGVMKPGSINSRTLNIRNTTNKPIRVLGTKKTCSCTMVDLQPSVLNPGEEVPVTATMVADFTPKDKSSVKVIVQFEGLAPRTIGIKGIISHAISSVPRDIRVHPRGYNDPTYRSNGVLTLRSLDGVPFRVLRSGGEPPVFVTPGETIETSALNHSIKWDVSEFDPETGLDSEGERIPVYWLIETDHPGSPVVEVALNHKIDRIQPRGDRPWFALDRRAVVDPVAPGQSAELLLPMNGLLSPKSEDDVINDIVSQSPQFQTSLLGFERHVDGKRINVRIQITPSPGHRGAYMGRVEILSPAYSMPFTIIGSVRESDET